jgi:hypothetical protein
MAGTRHSQKLSGAEHEREETITPVLVASKRSHKFTAPGPAATMPVVTLKIPGNVIKVYQLLLPGNTDDIALLFGSALLVCPLNELACFYLLIVRKLVWLRTNGTRLSPSKILETVC